MSQQNCHCARCCLCSKAVRSYVVRFRCIDELKLALHGLDSILVSLIFDAVYFDDDMGAVAAALLYTLSLCMDERLRVILRGWSSRTGPKHLMYASSLVNKDLISLSL